MVYEIQIAICVDVLTEYLQRCSHREEKVNLLKQEKEGWVEYQLTSWAAQEIKTKYCFDVWELGFYFGIDIYEQLLKRI